MRDMEFRVFIIWNRVYKWNYVRYVVRSFFLKFIFENMFKVSIVVLGGMFVFVERFLNGGVFLVDIDGIVLE